METPLASRAPRLAASMMPGPPPEMTANPRFASPSATFIVHLYDQSFFAVRALPKMEMAGPMSFNSSNPSTNSLMMRNTRQVSPPASSSIDPPILR